MVGKSDPIIDDLEPDGIDITGGRTVSKLDRL